LWSKLDSFVSFVPFVAQGFCFSQKKKKKEKKKKKKKKMLIFFCQNRDVYRLCTAQPKPYTERLYVEFREFVLGHVMRTAQEMRESDGAALRDYRARWRTYRTGMQYLHSVFRYLNNNWIKKTLEDGRNRLGGLFQSEGAASKDVHEIYTLGLLLWKEKVFDPVAKQRIIPEILEQVRAERK
jgi:hypothetical protein